MNRAMLARLHRTLRHRLRLTQAQLAARARVSEYAIGRLEAVDLDRLRFGDLERSFAALGCDLRVNAFYRGATAERLLDEGHALLVGAFVELLRRLRWEVRIEVSFAEFGERGSIDILAWHAATRALLVVEVKSELGGIDATLRPLDVKVRLAPVVARRLGWQPRHVARILVLPEQSTARRAVRRHAAVLDRALAARSRELRRWLRRPRAAIAGIWFLSFPRATRLGPNPSARQRVRHPRPRREEPP
jgi:transcriptional regulator with XRE-family HTH domain